MKENKPLDTYFFSAKKALEVAKKQNRVETSVKTVDALQVCYYAGEEELENTLKNCIYVPLEEVYNYFISTKKRFPKAISFEDTEYSMPEQAELNAAFSEILGAAKEERSKLVDLYAEEIRLSKLDFNDKKLRVFIPACRETTVMQFVAKNIADAFEELGYEVFYNIQDELSDCSTLTFLVNHLAFNPHITVNINHLSNDYISEDVFNFIWVQDPIPQLFNDQELNLRERDYFFTLVDEYNPVLRKKGLRESHLLSQSFATNPRLFFEDTSIKKENKIIFLGSDYNFEARLSATITDKFLQKLYSNIDNNELSPELIDLYAKELYISFDDMNTWIIASIVRRRIIIWLCSLKNIEIEVYGTDTWLNNPEVVPYYKGLLPYGEEMSKVYNSAKYSICAHPKYKYQQRIFEISACGSIPIVYDCPLMSEQFDHDDNILTFSTLSELEECIGKTPKKDPRQIAEDISYKNMVNTITDIVNKTLG